MNYNSGVFWALFLILMVPYWFLSHRRQNRLLLIVSYIFYGFWDYRFLFLILLSTYIDFIGGLGVAGRRYPWRKMIPLTVLVCGSSLLLCTGIQFQHVGKFVRSGDWSLLQAAAPTSPHWWVIPAVMAVVGTAYVLLQPCLFAASESVRRKGYLLISLTANLGILGYFKYCDFFIANLRQVASGLGWGDWQLQALGILLPAGISFYTFQSMSYCIDIYRQEAEPTDDFLDFALFVCFFPHLVAGPIMRAHTLLPQVVEPRRIVRTDWEEGAYLVLVGMFKKVVIADNLAPMANHIFLQFSQGNPQGMSGLEALIGVYAFALQIYGDFSGYSSVARGISKWLGFELAINFRQPYLAVSPSDFWKRWHISLSSWLRDYLYIPLGGNRGGTGMMYRNLIITMVLGGLWHGASWTFVAWGLYHGLLLCLFRVLNIRDVRPGRTVSENANYLARLVIMFHLTCFGWLLFRADSFATVISMCQAIVTDFLPHGPVVAPLALMAFYCAPLLALEVWLEGEDRIERLTSGMGYWRGLAYSYALILMLVFHASEAAEFIYFQF